MTEVPVWLAIVISFFALAGSLLTLLGCVGMARFESFYERVHAPTLGTSFGAIGILLASIIYFSVTGQR
ncbi:MAG: monovalent cation/proton antiporter, MnhG/PhaG subunit, partial [Devosia sp.]|nr:monovalent cation/proton antiporter, MnhG/PhaG subunit [Devosia sp.]